MLPAALISMPLQVVSQLCASIPQDLQEDGICNTYIHPSTIVVMSAPPHAVQLAHVLSPWAYTLHNRLETFTISPAPAGEFMLTVMVVSAAAWLQTWVNWS